MRRLEVAEGLGGGGELGESLYGGVGEAEWDSGQVVAHRDVDAAAGFDDGKDGGDFGSGLLAADVDPVFSSQRDRAHGVFGEVVAQLEFRSPPLDLTKHRATWDRTKAEFEARKPSSLYSRTTHAVEHRLPSWRSYWFQPVIDKNSVDSLTQARNVSASHALGLLACGRGRKPVTGRIVIFSMP